MKAMNNSVNLIGNLGKDVEILDLSNGKKKAVFSLATTSYFKNPKGDLDKDTQWHNVIAWGKNAELMAKSLAKGNKVVISGSIKYRSYEDKTGATKYTTEIIADSFMKMEAAEKSQPTASEAIPF